jgi:catechol 2,3-dioxygenase-like lactoylglutathione lyase family enzyme
MTDIPNLYRVIVQVSDIDQGAEFYSKLLGTEGRRIWGSRHYFDCGAVILALVDPAADEEEARPNPDNIYFSVNDIESMHNRASELACLSTGDVHGVAAGEIVTRPWGERSFYAFDPFGNPICFVDKATIFTGR